jgi:hypothetical protein
VSGSARRAPKRSRQRRPSAPARDFWGSDAGETAGPGATGADGVGGAGTIVPSVDPTALISSLGPPPFPGGAIAQHYFDAVYNRAAGFAVALAAASGLLAMHAGEPD